jgi:transposase
MLFHPLTNSSSASIFGSAIGNGSEFRKVRSVSAWLGLVPGEYTTGGKQKLLGISKRGNVYLRQLPVHGARAILQYREKQGPGMSAWLGKLVSRARLNVGMHNTEMSEDDMKMSSVNLSCVVCQFL